MKCSVIAFLLLLPCLLPAQTTEFKITKRYLNFPVSQTSDRRKMSFEVDGKHERLFDIRLTDTPEYWTFCDMEAFRGKTLIIRYEGDMARLSKIYQDDKPAGSDHFYTESNRPQLHFTPKVGWINDPNGLVYYDGEYHLFYQHNPYEREWGNMHWGHAVSRDLIRWTELPIALYPDSLGTMFSGSAVIDYENTSGFGTKQNPAMVAIYTADSPEKEVQCLAYSLDKGRSWTKYDGNPVIDSGAKWKTKDTRDPKVFWYAPGKKWVMVLNERDGHSIYNSTDLKEWTYESHTTGFWECPELFELPVEGDPPGGCGSCTALQVPICWDNSMAVPLHLYQENISMATGPSMPHKRTLIFQPGTGDEFRSAGIVLTTPVCRSSRRWAYLPS